VPQPIEAVASYARRADDVVRVVLVLPDDLRDVAGDALTSRRVWLRLRHSADGEHRAARVPARVTPGDRPRLDVDVPAAELAPGVWNLALRLGKGGPLVQLEARLLVTDTTVQPLALLAGPQPLTKMPEPEPRPA
jgi:hypothetical protein